MSTLLLHDTLTDTNGTTLQSHTPDSGGTWARLGFRGGGQTDTQNGEINANRGRSAASDTSSNLYRLSTAPTSADYDLSATINVSGAGTQEFRGLFARLTPTGTTLAEVDGYGARYIDSVTTGNRAIQLLKYVDGSVSVISTTTLNLGTGIHTFRFTVIGDTLTVYTDGVLRVTETDTSITAAGRIGVELPANANGAWVDDLLVYTYDDGADYPEVGDVRSGTEFGGGEFTGTLDLPAEADVKQGVTYDNETKTGTFEGEGGGDGRRPIEQFWFG